MSTARSSWPAFGRVPKPLVYSGVSDRAIRLVAILDDQAAIRADFTREQLGTWLACSIKSVERTIAELEESGWLLVHRSIDNRGQRPNRFELVWPDEVPFTTEIVQETAPESSMHPPQDATPVSGGGDTSDAHLQTPVSIGGDTGDALRGDTSDAHLNRKRDNIRRDKEAPTTKPRQRNPIFDALVDAFAIDATQLTKSKGSALGKITAELREVGATPDEIRARVTLMRRKWKPDMCTPFALASHWDEFAAGATGPAPQNVPHYWRRRST